MTSVSRRITCLIMMAIAGSVILYYDWGRRTGGRIRFGRITRCIPRHDDSAMYSRRWIGGGSSPTSEDSSPRGW